MLNKFFDALFFVLIIGGFAVMLATFAALQYQLGYAFAACLTGFLSLGTVATGVLLAVDTYKR